MNFVKVFSSTKARQRDGLGEEVTAWMKAVVELSSDSEFHCLTIVLFGRGKETPRHD